MIAVAARCVEHRQRHLAIEQPPSQDPAIHGPFDSPTADDERHRLRQRIRDRTRVRVAPSGDEGNVNARRDRFGDRLPIRCRQVPATVEQCAVDVNANQPYHAENLGNRRLRARLRRINRVTIRRL